MQPAICSLFTGIAAQRLHALMPAMRSFLLCSAAALLPCAAAAEDKLPGPIPATLVRVLDGDTVEVSARIWLDQVVSTEVRLAGVNAPEIYRPPCPEHVVPGETATAFVSGLGLSEVALMDVEHDKYGGRVVARLVLPDGRDLSAMLLEQHYAWPYGDPDPLCPAPDDG